MKVAICLVVKNEDCELPYWIAWYKALGFDSFIIYNDSSDDSTEAVILSLADCVDVRYSRNAINRDMHNIRQVRAYNDAVTRFGDEFDWIALFDVDEYLDLNGTDIKTYLENFAEASLVAFNWSCVGTNGHISRPAGPPFLNYTKHGTPDLHWNRHTKVIFRPSRLNDEISQVHNVSVSGNSVDAAGRPINWCNQFGGFTENAPDWQGGKLIHYQSRSLEHYVKRDRHLEQVRRDSADPLHTVVNKSEYSAVETSVSDRYLRGYLEWMQKIIAQQAETTARIVRSLPGSFLMQLASVLREPPVRIFQPSYRGREHQISRHWISFHESSGGILRGKMQDGEEWQAFYIENHFGQRLGATNQQLCVTAEAPPIIGVFCRGSRYVHLFSSDNTPLRVKGDPRLTPSLTYEVWQNRDGTIALSHPRTGRYLGFVPHGDYYVEMIRALAWESFELHLLSNAECPAHIRASASYLAKITSLEDFRRACETVDATNAPLLFNAVTALPPNERGAIRTVTKGIMGEHIA